MSSVLKFFGYTWVLIAAAFIILGHGMIWWKDGFWALAEILSPWNVINWVVTLLTLAPGIGLLILSDKLRERRSHGSPPR